MTDEQTIRDALDWPDGATDDWNEGLKAARAALDRLVAEHARMKAMVESAHGDLGSALARAEAAEKEAEMYRREAAHARTLASGWAEANAERAAKNLHNDARKIAEARCATLEAVLQAARDVIDNDGDDARWDRFCKAVEAATPPADGYALRCGVCEGMDAPGLTHNYDAVNCSATPPADRPRGYEAQENEHTTDVMLGRITPPAEKEETP